jgi:hypothetical protein
VDAADHGFETLPMRVHVSAIDGVPIIRVSTCDRKSSQKVWVNDIVIEEPGYRGFQTTVYCRLREKRDASLGGFPVSGWKYATQMPGYEVLGPCVPLDHGRKYAADVFGDAVGGAVFSVESDGTVRLFDELCERAQKRSGF